MNLLALRSEVIIHAFASLGGSEIATFAVVDANRTWAIIRDKTRAAPVGPHPEVAYISAAGNVPLDVGPLVTHAGVDDLNTTCVESRLL